MSESIWTESPPPSTPRHPAAIRRSKSHTKTELARVSTELGGIALPPRPGAGRCGDLLPTAQAVGSKSPHRPAPGRGGRAIPPSPVETLAKSVFVWDFDLRIAAGCRGVDGGGDSVQMDSDIWPLLVAKHYDGNLASGQILLVED